MTEVHAITAAGRSHSDQQRDRTRSYLITMGVRMAAFVAAFLIDHWIRWVLVGLAVVLPVIAVIGANSGAERRVVPSSYIDRRALPATRSDERDRSEIP